MIKCLIIDDEPVARNILRNYCQQLPVLQVLAEFGNALDAKDFLTTHGIDLLFLDIHMPVLSGISFLNTLQHPPLVIFTTAYQDYAVNAFDLAACDYLLKPFSLERFIVAVDKAKDKLASTNLQTIAENSVTNTPDAFFVKAGGKLFKVIFSACLYAEASGNYTRLVTTAGEVLTKMTFTEVMALLPEALFIQVHRSFIINKTLISYIDGNRVFVQGKEVPIAPNLKDDFLKAIGVKPQ